MADSSNFYTLIYGHFAHPVLAEIRQENFGEDIGQNSWVTADPSSIHLPVNGVCLASLLSPRSSGSCALRLASSTSTCLLLQSFVRLNMLASEQVLFIRDRHRPRFQ